MQLTVDGGGGDDVLIGTDEFDVLLGGTGDGVLLGGGGLDVFDGRPGDYVELQGVFSPIAAEWFMAGPLATFTIGASSGAPIVPADQIQSWIPGCTSTPPTRHV